MKGKHLQPRILHQERLSFRIGGEINNFSDKQKVKEYSNPKPIWKEILKALLWIAGRNWKSQLESKSVSIQIKKKENCESDDKRTAKG